MDKRSSLSHSMAAAIGALVMAALLAAPAALAQGQKVLKFIPQADLRILDPISTTAYITRNHGYMIYDTLFAIDAKFQVQPQMVDKYEVSNDKLTYTFTLRDGLKFHDGTPVRSADCIASIDRWSKRDALGQKMAESTESWTAVNDKTFTLKLKKPFRSRSKRWRSRRPTCRSSCPSASPRPMRRPISPSRSAPDRSSS